MSPHSALQGARSEVVKLALTRTPDPLTQEAGGFFFNWPAGRQGRCIVYSRRISRGGFHARERYGTRVVAAAGRARPLGRFAAAAFLATDHQTNKQTNERTDRRRHRVYPSLMRRGLKNQKIFAFSFLEMRSCQILQEYNAGKAREEHARMHDR